MYILICYIIINISIDRLEDDMLVLLINVILFCVSFLHIYVYTMMNTLEKPLQFSWLSLCVDIVKVYPVKEKVHAFTRDDVGKEKVFVLKHLMQRRK